MHIAIIGAGLCGLATAWYLLNDTPSCSPLSITIFEAKEIGAGASGIAAGLLHPYAGAHAKLNWRGKEGREATLQLLKMASKILQQPVFVDTGILRLALSEQQNLDYIKCANTYPEDVHWLTAEECLHKYPYLTPSPGLWIKQGIVVKSKLYLQGLWQACAQKGAILTQKRINTLEELKNFDRIIVATGASSRLFPETASLPLSIIKGQILELEWPASLPPLPFAVNSHSYLLMGHTNRTCLAGATFERPPFSDGPDLEVAKAKILPEVTAMLPALASAKIIECHTGLRAAAPHHRPLIEKRDPKTWVFTGMGSKGLLYHALMAKELAFQIKENMNF